MLKLIPALCLLMPVPALAETPRVVTDITPVQGLVSMVMGDLGMPDLLVDPGASPHGYALRPSQAAALQQADAVFWIGPALTPWLDGAIDTLSSHAEVVVLLEAPGTVTHASREEALFLTTEDAEAVHDHDHGDEATDPHAWLDPANAIAWLPVIADTLTDLDPDHAQTYHANAETAGETIRATDTALAAQLAPVADRPFVVYHDGYQYFARHYGLTEAGAIAVSDASRPSAARLAQLAQAVSETGVICAFSEPQFNPGLVETVAAGTNLRQAVIDPLGTTLQTGTTFYPNLLDAVGSAISRCLSD